MNTKIKTEAELNTAMRTLVKNIMEHVDYVYNIPLTAEAQAQFVRSMFHQAKEIRDTEPFARGEIQKALDEFMVKNAELQKSAPTVDDVAKIPAKKKKGRK